MRRVEWSRAAVLVFVAGVLGAGCGTWVKYPDDLETGGVSELPDFPEVDRFDHLLWDALLGEHVRTPEGDLYVLVDYDALAVTGESGFLLLQYVAMINSVDPAKLVDQDERLAYWLNGYNAAVVLGVVQQYGGDHGFSVLDSGIFFDDPIYGFGGQLLSLNQVEQGVLRGDPDHPSVSSATDEVRAFIVGAHADVFGGDGVDARIHVALNCASLGCPNLRSSAPHAYRSEVLDEQLDEMSAQFAGNDAKGAGPDGISRLFDWYGQDFVDDYGSVEAFLESHRPGGAGDVDLDSWLVYDWSLNAVP